MNLENVDAVLERAHFELYRDNYAGALDLLAKGRDICPDPRYGVLMTDITQWLRHLDTRDAYASAYERYYRDVRRKHGFRRVEEFIRTWSGRRTRRMVERCALDPEFRLLEQEVVGSGAREVFEAGYGEGRLALTLAARHPDVCVTGVEVSHTNARRAMRLNRFRNATLHEGLLEEADRVVPPGSMDLAYAFAVLEHVRDVDESVEAILGLLRPGGRFCFVVPMNDFEVLRTTPRFAPRGGMAGHVRLFTDFGLKTRFGHFPGFRLERVGGRWRPDRYPEGFAPLRFGSFFVAFSKP